MKYPVSAAGTAASSSDPGRRRPAQPRCQTRPDETPDEHRRVERRRAQRADEGRGAKHVAEVDRRPALHRPLDEEGEAG